MKKYQLIFDGNEQNYKISSLSPTQRKNLQESYITNEVHRLSQNRWVSTNKNLLIEYAKKHRQARIEQLQRLLGQAENREILVQ